MTEEAKNLLLDGVKTRLERMGFRVDIESEASEFLEFEERPTAKRIRVRWEHAQAIVITKIPLGGSPDQDFEDVVIRDLMSIFGGLMKRTRKTLEAVDKFFDEDQERRGEGIVTPYPPKLLERVKVTIGKHVFMDEELEEEGSEG